MRPRYRTVFRCPCCRGILTVIGHDVAAPPLGVELERLLSNDRWEHGIRHPSCVRNQAGWATGWTRDPTCDTQADTDILQIT